MTVTLLFILGSLVVFVAAFVITSLFQNSGGQDDFNPLEDQRRFEGSSRSRVQPIENQLPSGNPNRQNRAAALADIDAELRSLLAHNHKIEAIKRVRAVSGWGLKDAKDYIDQMAAGSIRSGMTDANSTLADMDDELRSLLAHNRKIEAIKQVRMATGWGLKEAKTYVDQLDSRRY